MLHPYVIDMTGKRIGSVLVVGPAPSGRKRGTYWDVLCDCGNRSIVHGDYLRTAAKVGTRFCGTSCPLLGEQIRKRNSTHGGSQSSLYKVWRAMLNRCLNPNAIEYKNYGERGVTIYPRWVEGFEFFREDVGPSYIKGHHFDRKNTNEGYYPGNVRWVTPTINAKNRWNCWNYKREDVPDDYMEQIRAVGISESAMRARLKRGWSWERLITTPVRIVKPYERRRPI